MDDSTYLGRREVKGEKSILASAKPQTDRGVSFISGHDRGSEMLHQENPYDFGAPFGKYFVDIDVGGTYIDAVISRKNLVKFFKVDITPNDLGQCFQEVIWKATKFLKMPDVRTFLSQTHVIRLSTSLSINILVERKGGRIGLLMTKGWRTRYLAQASAVGTLSPIFFEDMVMEIDIEVNSRTSCHASPLEEEVREKAFGLLEKGATIIVVSLEGSETCPANECQIQSIINKYYPKHFIGSVPILRSTQTGYGSDYIRRTNTAVINAYCHDQIAAQLFQIEDFLRDMECAVPLLIVHSKGGSARVAKALPIQIISSGAAAGIFGASRMSISYCRPDVISVDVGGTSTEIGLVRRGEIVYSIPAHVESLPVDMSLPVASTLGIGGGSIARIDQRGQLNLGPESAGAFPGPACYDLGGTEPTLTDAYLILGYFDENYFLGGQKRIRKSITQKVFTEKIARPLGISCEEAAFMVKRKAVEMIGERIRAVALKNDLILSEVSLFAIGGGGGVIGGDLFDLFGFKETFFFRQGSVFGAFGSTGMDIMHTYEKAVDVSLVSEISSPEEICRKLNSTVLSLQRMAFKDMLGEGFQPEEILFELELELNTATSGSHIRLALPSPFIWLNRDWLSIQQMAKGRFGYENGSVSGYEVRISKVLLKALVAISHADVKTVPNKAASGKYDKGKRPVYVEAGKWVEANVYEWDFLYVPVVIDGPSLIESQDTTIVVPPDKKIRFDKNFNGVMEAR